MHNVRRIFIVVSLGIMLIVPIFQVEGQTGTQDGFQPIWKLGDTWVVEARYRNFTEGGDSWLPPIRWRFHVRSDKEVDGEACFMLHVVPLGRSEMKVQAVLWLAKRDLRPVRVVDVYPLRGVATAKRREFNQSRLTPLFPEYSMIPYHLPLFPLCDSDGRNNSTLVVGEKVVQAASTTFVDRVSQTWKRTQSGFAIDLEDAGPEGLIHQEWRPGLPWAVTQTGRGMEVKLVEPRMEGSSHE